MREATEGGGSSGETGFLEGTMKSKYLKEEEVTKAAMNSDED